MSPCTISLLLRSSSSSSYPKRLLYTHHFSLKTLKTPFSISSSSPSPQPTPDPKTSLSSRMSFVFDQIDAIERECSLKDQALQRIRTWHDQKTPTPTTPQPPIPSQPILASPDTNKAIDSFSTKEIELVHPWPEWIELMERLVRQNYFDHRRKDEDCMVPNVPLDNVDAGGCLGFVEEGFHFTRDWTTVRTACLNFGRDRFDILRSLAKKDIQILVGHGCPSVDTKVVFSAKLLRKHAHLDEGDVCSSCNLRNSCSRAYLLTRKEDEARTLDVMRVLLTYGFDPVIGSVENKSLLKLKSVKTVVRKLLHEIVKLSAIPIDPNLPPPVIKKPPPKVKQPPPTPKKRVGRDDIEMKKGDWLCPKCDFMNFAKNTVCLQCNAKRPKRQLLPGEWECPECNFLNYRRNMACFHCEHKRPPDEYIEKQVQAKSHASRTRPERVANISDVSNAWNFDFDDNESDGADVAAFEYADPPRISEDNSQDGRSYRVNSRGLESESFENNRTQEIHETGRNSASVQSHENAPSVSNGTGFDDFDDEDDIDSYELDIPNKNSKQETSTTFSKARGFSGSEDFEDSDQFSNSHHDSNSLSCDNQSHAVRGRAAFSGSDGDEKDFDSENEFLVHPNWKSSHVADCRVRTRGRVETGPSRGLSFVSDSGDEFGLNSDSDVEDIGVASKWNKVGKQSSNRRGYQSNRLDAVDDIFYDSESYGDDGPRFHRNKAKGDRSRSDGRGNAFVECGHSGSRRDISDRRGKAFRERGYSGSGRDSQFRSNCMARDMVNSFDESDSDKSYGGFRRAARRSQTEPYDRWSVNRRGGNSQGNNDGPAKKQRFGYRRLGSFKDFNDSAERTEGRSYDKPHRRIIER